MSIRCRTPLITLCSDASRIRVQMSECGECSPDATALRITQGGCPKYEEVCVEVTPRYGCGTPNMPAQQQIITRELPRVTLTYPLHEVDSDGFATFVLDNKLMELGYGRYNAQVLTDGCAPITFDIDLVCGRGSLRAVAIDRSGCGSAM